MSENFDIEKDDLINIFDDFIKPGAAILEREIAKGFKVKLKVLDVGEALSAESIMSYDRSKPADIVARVRSASILSRAILELNGIPITKDGMDYKATERRRALLYSQLLKMPPIIIQKTYELYIEAFNKQTEFYSDLNKTIDEMKDF